MKKVISYMFAVLVLSLGLCSQEAQARTYKMMGYARTHISTEKDVKHSVTIEVPPQKIFGANATVEKTVMLKAQITSVVPAARGKRNGYVTIKILSYKPGSSDEYIDVSSKNFEFGVKAYSEIDFKGLGVSAATSTVSHVLGVPFLSQGVAAVKGAVKPAEGQTRLASAGESVYQSTPLSYISKGKELNVLDGDKLTLSFKIPEAEKEGVSSDSVSESQVKSDEEFTKDQLSE